MAGRELCGMDILKWIEFVLSVCGLVFVSLWYTYSYGSPLALLILFAFSTLYLVIHLLCALVGKNIMSNLVMTLIELILGIMMIIYTVVYMGRSWDVWPILTMVAAFLLTAVFVVSAFSRHS